MAGTGYIALSGVIICHISGFGPQTHFPEVVHGLILGETGNVGNRDGVTFLIDGQGDFLTLFHFQTLIGRLLEHYADILFGVIALFDDGSSSSGVDVWLNTRMAPRTTIIMRKAVPIPAKTILALPVRGFFSSPSSYS